MRELSFDKHGWEDYLYWQNHDRKFLKRINRLINAALRDPYEGEGKPEPLKYHKQTTWSRRIDQEHRLVYVVEKEKIIILQCRFHYDR
jgi:toxin YoeB